MPNTIAHFAINGLFTRTIITHADFKWIYLACVIPDFPWILQRVVKASPFAIDLYDLRAYCIAQSSFLLCIFLSMAFAMLEKQRSKVFIILVIGSLLHLLLDAVQVKWANGVQLLAPLNWNLLRFDLFWPESMGTYLLTAAGLIYFIFNFRKSVLPNCNDFAFSKSSLSLSVILLLAWLVLPIVYVPSVYAADNHFISTLKDIQHRTGKYIEIDRNRYTKTDGNYRLTTSYGEIIKLSNIDAQSGELISLQGKFIDSNTIHVEHYRVHSQFRNIAAMFGLSCVLLVWMIFIARCSMEGLRIKGKDD